MPWKNNVGDGPKEEEIEDSEGRNHDNKDNKAMHDATTREMSRPSALLFVTVVTCCLRRGFGLIFFPSSVFSLHLNCWADELFGDLLELILSDCDLSF